MTFNVICGFDEKQDSEVVKVAEGVCFIGTANIGNEYTATRVMDRALMSRFPIKIEMTPMDFKTEFEYLKTRFSITDESLLKTLSAVCEIASLTREQMKNEDSKLTNFIPTRSTVEMSELILDGFDLIEIAETAIYPNFMNDGGVDSERTYMKQVVQKYIPNTSPNTLINDPLNNSQPPF